MEDTILELVEICRQKELLCMHDNVDDLIESAFNSKLLSINSQRPNKEKQEVENVVEQPAELAPILSTKEHEYSPSMRYEHPNTILEIESDEIIKSGVEELVPILSENEDVEYVEASLPDPEIVSIEEENVVYQEEEEVDLEDIFQIQDIVLHEKLLSINRLIANIESLNDNSTPDCLLNSFVSFPISKKSNNSLLDNFSLEFETFCDHTEETRSGNTTTHANVSFPEYDLFCFEIEPDQGTSVLEELLIDDSIPFPINETPESNFDNPSFPRPPPEPPDAETNAGEEILVLINEFECLDPKDEFDDDDYSSFMFVKLFFLSAESEDTIFYPGISV
nr:hypothetical protein [Tanacetum cinerariifolium]